MPKNNDALNIDRLEQSTHVGKIHYFKTIDSTNNWLVKQGECGDICISDVQLAGKGRRGNEWLSSVNGNVYFSLCWCFKTVTKNWSLLGLVVGVAVAEALKEMGLKNHGVKWPNDIFWQGKKLGGVLLETIDLSGKVVIGIGLNINMPIDSDKKILNQPVTCLKTAIHPKEITREEVLAHLINHLTVALKGFPVLEHTVFTQNWAKWDVLSGKQVYFDYHGKEVKGRVINIDPHGRIGIEMGLDKLMYFSSADIRFEKKSWNH